MPHLFSFANHTNDDSQQEFDHEEQPAKRLRRQGLFRKPLNLLRRQPDNGNEPPSIPNAAPAEFSHLMNDVLPLRPSTPEHVPCRKAVPSLPRPQTFRRRQSEQRERLLEVPPSSHERRTLSVDRRRSFKPLRPLSPNHLDLLSAVSAPNIVDSAPTTLCPPNEHVPSSEPPPKPSWTDLPPLQIPDPQDREPFIEADESLEDQIDKSSLQEEFEHRWILNLSMHFRDKSNREKFFVTYAEKPNQWRRLTVSLDYRNAPPASLEHDLSTLHFQRDKSLCIYEAIRESLPEIQYYDTVTNLKLETGLDDGQLHVHVREDANETIHFPPVSLFDHIRCPRFAENTLDFVAHLSGFVYKVKMAGRVVIKKEIPGPDTVDEFLYEVNALDALLGANNVVQIEGLVTDDRGESVKGLLISYASKGSLVDMIYDFRATSQLPWHRREKWAKQIVAGLAEVHEAGFVQGDFTLSNIVIDENDDAQIIDINRRGCPVGWEPPELSRLIDSGQRISMCIGVKTDLFQLGMCLWALAEEVDEPERVQRPLPDILDAIPAYFREMVNICLSERPQGRMGAKQLLQLFPGSAGLPSSPAHSDYRPSVQVSGHSGSTTSHRSDKEYIDPQLAVTIDEVKERRKLNHESSDFGTEQVTYVNPDSNAASSTYRFDSSESWIFGRTSRGRSPVSSRRRRSSPCGRTVSSATSLSEYSPIKQFRADARDDAVPRSPCDDVRGTQNISEPQSPTKYIDRHLSALQIQDVGRVAELLHTDSGFDETMGELDADASYLSDIEIQRRPKTYMPDEELASLSEETPTPGSKEIAKTGAMDDDLRDRAFSTASIDTKRRASA